MREVLGPPRPQATILVVDDDESIRRLFRQILTEAGYQVLVACDGGEAWRWRAIAASIWW